MNRVLHAILTALKPPERDEPREPRDETDRQLSYLVERVWIADRIIRCSDERSTRNKVCDVCGDPATIGFRSGMRKVTGPIVCACSDDDHKVQVVCAVAQRPGVTQECREWVVSGRDKGTPKDSIDI